MLEMPQDSLPHPGDPDLVEGTARVVAVAANLAWLEPEQTTSCGGCASAGLCGAKGLGTTASLLERRRFALPNTAGLRVGDRVVMGVSQRALLTASSIAYALPLLAMFVAGGVAQSLAGRDGVTIATMVVALVLGLAAARFGARHLAARGLLAPRILRRAGPDESCRIT